MGSRASLSESQRDDLYETCPAWNVPYDPRTQVCKNCDDRHQPGLCSHIPPVPIWKRVGSTGCPERRTTCDVGCPYYSTHRSYGTGGSCNHPDKKWIIKGWRKRY